MPGKKKADGCNGFMNFSEHIRADLQEECGRHLSKERLVEMAAPHWQELSADERQQWKDAARWQRDGAVDGAPRRPRERPLTAPRHPLHQLRKRPDGVVADERENAAEIYYGPTGSGRFALFRRRTLKNLVEQLEWSVSEAGFDGETVMRKKPFHLLSVVSHCPTAGHEFPPAEAALLSFTLGGGVSHVRHWFFALDRSSDIDPLLLADAEQSHGIGADNQEAMLAEHGLTQNYDKVVCTILGALRHFDTIFIRADNYNEAQGCLAWLKRRREQQLGRRTTSVKADELACVEELAGALSKVVGGVVDMEAVERACGRSDWPLEGHCSFHGSLPSPRRCAVAMARAALYGLFDALHTLYGVEMGEKHRPPKLAVQQVVAPVTETSADALPTVPADDSSIAAAVTSGAPAVSIRATGDLPVADGVRRPKTIPPSCLRVGQVGRGVDVVDEQAPPTAARVRSPSPPKQVVAAECVQSVLTESLSTATIRAAVMRAARTDFACGSRATPPKLQANTPAALLARNGPFRYTGFTDDYRFGGLGRGTPRHQSFL